MKKLDLELIRKRKKVYKKYQKARKKEESFRKEKTAAWAAKEIRKTIDENYASIKGRAVLKTGIVSKIKRYNSLLKTRERRRRIENYRIHGNHKAISKSQVLVHRLNALEALLQGKIFTSAKELDKISDNNQYTDNNCIVASFLDRMGRLDKRFSKASEKYWVQLADDIMRSAPEQGGLERITNSKNQVMTFSRNGPGKEMFIVKSNENKARLLQEYNTTKTLHKLIGRKGMIPEPLAIMMRDYSALFIMKRAQGISLYDALADKSNPTKIINQLLETLDRYNLRIACHLKNKPEDIIIDRKDYGSELNKKILDVFENEGAYLDRTRWEEGFNTVLSILKAQPRGYIHGDLHADNIIVSKQSLCLIDHESVKYGARILDLARFMTHLKVKYNTDLTELARRGYRHMANNNTTMDSYLAGYHAAAAFEATKLAATTLAYTTPNTQNIIEEVKTACRYLNEAKDSLWSLKHARLKYGMNFNAHEPVKAIQELVQQIYSMHGCTPLSRRLKHTHEQVKQNNAQYDNSRMMAEMLSRYDGDWKSADKDMRERHGFFRL